MKKYKKMLLLFLLSVITFILLTSCEGINATPKESASIFLDIILKNDKSKMNRIGINKEDYAKLKDIQEDNIMKCFGLQGVDNSTVSDEIKNNLKNTISKSVSKLNYKVTTESTDEEAAKIDIEIKAFDMNKILNESQDKIKQKYMDNPSMTQKDILQEYYKILGETIGESPIKEEPTIIEISLNKKDGKWEPDENAEVNILNAIVKK